MTFENGLEVFAGGRRKLSQLLIFDNPDPCPNFAMFPFPEVI
jgi:hypothetical protein